MQAMFRIAVLPGDGIGPEVTAEAVKVLKTVEEVVGPRFRFQSGLIGGCALNATAVPLPAETISVCNNTHAILLGAVGGPEWDTKRADLRPEQGLLQLRQRLGLYVNLRPAKVLDSLVGISALKPDRVRGTDLVIVRELLGGIYFGNPRGIFAKNGERMGINTEVYREHEVERVAHRAFQLARMRRRKVTSVDKANVLESSRLWREVVTRIGRSYPDVTLEHLYVDNCAMKLIDRPASFDVILTNNMFGDILSDEAAMLTGSIGLLPSASLGERTALYEPVHGSAPDIAGRNRANPIAAIASAALMLRYSLRMERAADAIETAIEKVLKRRVRTAEMPGRGRAATTSRMGDLVAKETKKLLKSSKFRNGPDWKTPR
ncbi:MAG: 3-isopropylmalate dehydrogenase [Acidobacteria bacterium]|nr:3-isopropylmalate dehydrogenase [Acidobacteriota bacterium]MBI1982610.1 3-isopropylmalate dehydrogenase [Acidobacteriota bacterium]